MCTKKVAVGNAPWSLLRFNHRSVILQEQLSWSFRAACDVNLSALM